MNLRFGFFATLLALVHLCGCMSLKTASKPALVGYAATPERCSQLNDRNAMYTLFGASAAVAAGGSGFSTITTENSSAKAALAISSIVFGAFAAGMQAGAHKTAEQFISEGCSSSPE